MTDNNFDEKIANEDSKIGFSHVCFDNSCSNRNYSFLGSYTIMSVAELFKETRLPVLAAPLFIISYPELVIAQCKAGVIGSFPSIKCKTC